MTTVISNATPAVKSTGLRHEVRCCRLPGVVLEKGAGPPSTGSRSGSSPASNEADTMLMTRSTSQRFA